MALAHDIKRSSLLKKELINFKTNFEGRLSNLEAKVDYLIASTSTVFDKFEKVFLEKDEGCVCKAIIPKLNELEDLIKSQKRKMINTDDEDPESSSDPVGFFQPKRAKEDELKPDSNMQIITLKTEEDLPEGSWLGDENNPKARVRVNIPPSLWLHINQHALTPEKMALTLLDCLFPREVLAISNLSGKGKNSKRQLDPVLIYGIRCHLIHKFNISNKDWHRIKQNIDSKCRTMWRKKVRGIPLGNSLVMDVDPLRLIRTKGEQVVHLADGQTIEVFTDEEFKELLPSTMGLFVEEGLNLTDETLIITENSSEKAEEDDAVYKTGDYFVKLEKKLD